MNSHLGAARRVAPWNIKPLGRAPEKTLELMTPWNAP
jgi:hypothetical protein